jgi:hypothetical protein
MQRCCTVDSSSAECPCICCSQPQCQSLDLCTPPVASAYRRHMPQGTNSRPTRTIHRQDTLARCTLRQTKKHNQKRKDETTTPSAPRPRRVIRCTRMRACHVAVHVCLTLAGGGFGSRRRAATLILLHRRIYCVDALDRSCRRATAAGSRAATPLTGHP